LCLVKKTSPFGICSFFKFYNTADLLFNNYRIVVSCLRQKAEKNILFIFHSINVSCLPTENYLYRVHGSAFGYVSGPCIIILTRGRNELFFRIIFKEKVIFLFFIFFIYRAMPTRPTRLFSGVNYDKSCGRLLTEN